MQFDKLYGEKPVSFGVFNISVEWCQIGDSTCFLFSHKLLYVMEYKSFQKK